MTAVLAPAAFQPIDWERVLRRLEAGERQPDVWTGRDGMPTERQFRARKAADSAFAERVRAIAAARRLHLAQGLAGRSLTKRMATQQREKAQRDAEIDWDAVLARLKASEPLWAVCSGRDGWPTMDRWYGYLQEHPDFAEAAALSHQGQKGVAVRPERVEGFLEQLATKPLAEASQVAGVSTTAIRNRVRRDRAFAERFGVLRDARIEQRATERDGRAERAIQRLEAGSTIREATAGLSLAGWHGKYRGAGESRPAIERLRVLIQRRSTEYRRERQQAAERLTAARRAVQPDHFYREAVQRHLMADEVYAVVSKAVARIDIAIREDVRGDMILAVLGGELALVDVGCSVGRYVGLQYGDSAERRTPSLNAGGMEGDRAFGDSLIDASFYDLGDVADLEFAEA